VRQKVNEEKVNIKKFWQKRMGQYGQNRMEEIQQEEEAKQQKEGILARLLDYENQQVMKLQHSQRSLVKLETILKDNSIERKQKYLNNLNTPKRTHSGVRVEF